MSESLGFAHFIAQTDSVGSFVLLVLALMSVVSWYLIVLKTWLNRVVRARSSAFLARFGSVRNLNDAERLLAQDEPADPFGRLLEQGLASCRQLHAPDERRGFELSSPDDFVSAALHRNIANENRGLETGLSSLASIGSTAPFVGLFGTVWGIYHALLAIGFSGQASLDRVAGPVGEALIMTACGLAVAIPAVLAYNAFVRANRNLIGELESYAHEVFGLLGIGHLTVPAGGAELPARGVPAILNREAR
jgi:biopolymer transport protein ExbB